MSRFDEWLTAHGKVREYATAMDEILWLREERNRLRLTDSERDAVAWCANSRLTIGVDRAATLRSLLERHK